MQQRILAGIYFLEPATIFDELDEAIIIIVPDGNHRRRLLEFILRCIR